MTTFMKRMAVAKSLGFLVGLIGFFMVPHLMPNGNDLLPWGILFWYALLGAFIGMAGFVTKFKHPFGFTMNFSSWFRGALIGGWMNFVLVFFAHEAMTNMLETLGLSGSIFLWFILEGILLGILIDVVSTRAGGEGKELFKDIA